MSPLPFFCAICDKEIAPSKDKKYGTIHEKCMKKYLSEFNIATDKEYNASLSTGKKKK